MNDQVDVAAVKVNVKNVDTWARGVFIVIYAVIFYVLFWILWLVVIFQFVMKVLLGKLNPQLMSFSAGLTRYALQILRYVTFQSEERPWPVGPWPEDRRPITIIAAPAEDGPPGENLSP